MKDSTLHNYRTVTEPIGKAARQQHMKPLSDLDHLWIQRVRATHNPIGNWLHALMSVKGLSRAEALATLDRVITEIKEA